MFSISAEELDTLGQKKCLELMVEPLRIMQGTMLEELAVQADKCGIVQATYIINSALAEATGNALARGDALIVARSLWLMAKLSESAAVVLDENPEISEDDMLREIKVRMTGHFTEMVEAARELLSGIAGRVAQMQKDEMQASGEVPEHVWKN